VALAWTLLEAGTLAAAPEMASGIFRGDLAGIDGGSETGRLEARGADGALVGCQYDSRSLFEMDGERVFATRLRPGDPIQVVADRHPGSQSCYARIVSVVAPPRAQRPARRPVRTAAQDPPPAGGRVIAGVVTRIEPRRLTLRTRSGQESLRLRPDTRYLGGGGRATPDELMVNMRVSVRAGPGWSGELEAYQVVWGAILDPR
jgi:hypothetical protein